jgi:hypothetical protein
MMTIYKVENNWENGIKVVEIPIVHTTPTLLRFKQPGLERLGRIRKNRTLGDWWGYSEAEAIDRFIAWCNHEIREAEQRAEDLGQVRHVAALHRPFNEPVGY